MRQDCFLPPGPEACPIWLRPSSEKRGGSRGTIVTEADLGDARSSHVDPGPVSGQVPLELPGKDATRIHCQNRAGVKGARLLNSGALCCGEVVQPSHLESRRGPILSRV
jgi:hypothetical protein